MAKKVKKCHKLVEIDMKQGYDWYKNIIIDMAIYNSHNIYQIWPKNAGIL